MQSGATPPQQQNGQFGGQQYGGTHGQLINGSPALTGPPPMQRSPQPVATATPQQAPAASPGPPQGGQNGGLPGLLAGAGASGGGSGMMQPGALGGNQQLIQALRNAGLA